MVKAKHELKGHDERMGSKHMIGTLGERSLHSSLKDWYARPGDRKEVQVEGFHIDIVRRNLLIEIQTTNFSSQKRKLNALIEKHPLRLVLPIAQEKWIVRVDADRSTPIGRRKSPKKGKVFHLFRELVSIPDLIKQPNFSLEVLLIREEEIRCDDGKGSWRRKGLSIVDHRLAGVVDQHLFKRPSDFLSLVPIGMAEPFSTEELAESINEPRWLAQKMAYCLRNMGVMDIVGKTGNSILYSISSSKTIA